MDLSPLYHTLIAVACCAVGILCNNPLAGAAFGAALYLGREHAQAENRWIKLYGQGKRANMPWWGGFDVRVWDMGSLLDWCCPVAGVLLVALVAIYLRGHG